MFPPILKSGSQLNDAFGTVAATASTIMARDANGRAQIAPPSVDADIANKGYVDTTVTQANSFFLCEFYRFRHPTLRTGFQPAQGGLLANAATLYPDAWAYLQTVAGQLLCKTEAQWQTMSTATWATLADGSKVGWNGIGGVPFYAPNLSTGDLRLPDLRGMVDEVAGYDSLDVGNVHGDAGRRVQASWVAVGLISSGNAGTGAAGVSNSTQGAGAAGPGDYKQTLTFDSDRVVPTANKFQVRAYGVLGCVYLGAPAA
ncbi:MAG: hypothetical protein LBB52_03985 [Desulfovibrio sp.]|jgi:hypothetical protein|nr:hypothetical protein [Desulfovibrio sp.]